MLRRIGVTVSSNNLFQHAYAKIEFVENELCVARRTASQYLSSLYQGLRTLTLFAVEMLERRLFAENGYLF